MSTLIEDIEDEDNVTETTRLVPATQPGMHDDTRDDNTSTSSTSTNFVPVKKYKDYNNLIYLSVLTILLRFPLGLVALMAALKAHEDAKSGHIVRAKKKAMATYLFIAAALVADVIIVVSVVVATI